MCDPVTIAVLAVLSSAAATYQQYRVARATQKNQEAAYRDTRRLALADMFRQHSAATSKQAQINEGTSLEIQRIMRASRAAAATGRNTGSFFGVSGHTYNALLGQFEKRFSESAGGLARNNRNQLNQLQYQKDAIRSRAYGNILGARPDLIVPPTLVQGVLSAAVAGTTAYYGATPQQVDTSGYQSTTSGSGYPEGFIGPRIE